MFCRKCGKEIPGDSKFCPKCGTVIGKEIFKQASAQTDKTVVDVPNNTSVSYIASESPQSDTADTVQTVLDETKPENSNKPLIIISVFGVIILAVLAVILIPLFTSKNLDTNLNLGNSAAELNSKSIEAYDQFKYHLLDDDTYIIDGYTGNDINVIIPDTIDGKPVSAIGEKAFSGSSIESVTIGKNVWEIGDSAFSNCSNLHTVEMLSNDDFVVDIIEGDILIHSIGFEAFAYCYNLEIFIFPLNNYTKIAGKAFCRCKALKNVELTGIWSIGSAAFSESGLQSVNLQTGETYPAVFADCKDLKEVTLGNLVDISDEMFSGCTSLETVNWNFSPYMENKIGSNAFYGCTSLKQFNTIDTPITYPRGFSEFIEEFRSLGAKDIVIGEDAFRNCGSFKDPELPKMTFTTIINNEGEYEDKWDYIFYDDPSFYGNWDIIGMIDTNQLDNWIEGKIQPMPYSNNTMLKNLKLYSNGSAVITYSSGNTGTARWTRGYVCHNSVCPSVSKIVTAAINGVDYLAFEHKSGDYSKNKKVSIYFILKRNSNFTDIPDTPNISNHSSYSALDISKMTYADVVRTFGEPDWFFWERGRYENMDIGYSFDKYTARECFTTSNNDRIAYVVLEGGKDTMINNSMHLGEGYDYYNNFLSFDLYDALKVEYGDLGAAWYKVGIAYSNSSGPLYNVDLRFSLDDEICYAAKVTYLR